MSGTRTVYWDSSVFIAWFTNEAEYFQFQGGMEEVATLVSQNKINLMTSTITTTETLPSGMQSAINEIERFFKRSNVYVVAPELRITHLSRSIRDHYNQKNVKVKTPDAIHLATAIHYDVHMMHTFDKQLLKLNGNVDGHSLRIERPMGQMRMYFPEQSKNG